MHNYISDIHVEGLCVCMGYGVVISEGTLYVVEVRRCAPTATRRQDPRLGM